MSETVVDQRKRQFVWRTFDALKRTHIDTSYELFSIDNGQQSPTDPTYIQHMLPFHCRTSEPTSQPSRRASSWDLSVSEKSIRKAKYSSILHKYRHIVISLQIDPSRRPAPPQRNEIGAPKNNLSIYAPGCSNCLFIFQSPLHL